MGEEIYSLRRDIEFFPIRHQGRELVIIRDHLRLVAEGRAIPVALYNLISILYRPTGIRNLQTELMRLNGGVLVSEDEVRSLLLSLDEWFLLDSPRFRIRREEIRNEFIRRPVRAPSHCGIAYPSDSKELERTIESLLVPGAHCCSWERPPLAVVAPHIDIAIGGELYGKAYGALKGLKPKRVIVLGVGHQMSEGLFSLTRKGFETPFGTADCDTEAVEGLIAAGEGMVEKDDFAHRSEHSIEFQVIFLQKVLESQCKLIPMLCGSPQISLAEYSRKAFIEKAGNFISVLKEIALSPETLIVAGVDMSHIGPKFGHDSPARFMSSESETHDRTLLSCALRHDADGLWKESQRVQDRYNVCGFPALALMMELLPPAQGTLLDYRVWKEDAAMSSVSFAAAIFHGESS